MVLVAWPDLDGPGNKWVSFFRLDPRKMVVRPFGVPLKRQTSWYLPQNVFAEGEHEGNQKADKNQKAGPLGCSARLLCGN